VDLRLNKPELRIEVERDKAADLGVSVEVVAKAIETLLGGRNVTRYKRDAEQYDVVVQTAASGRTTPEDIDRIYVRGRNDAMIPLSSLVKVTESVSPRELNHFGQRRSVSITASLAANYSLGEALVFMDQTAAKVLKSGYSTDLNGTSREFRNSQGALVSRHELCDVDNGGWNITKSPCPNLKGPNCKKLQAKARTQRPKSSML
jgi:multidrug efflux pump